MQTVFGVANDARVPVNTSLYDRPPLDQVQIGINVP